MLLSNMWYETNQTQVISILKQSSDQFFSFANKIA